MSTDKYKFPDAHINDSDDDDDKIAPAIRKIHPSIPTETTNASSIIAVVDIVVVIVDPLHKKQNHNNEFVF